MTSTILRSYLPRFCLLFEQIKHYLCWPVRLRCNPSYGGWSDTFIKIVPIPSTDKDTRMMISTSPWNCVCVSVCCILAASLTVVTRAGVPHWPGVPALQRSHYSIIVHYNSQVTSKHQVTGQSGGQQEGEDDIQRSRITQPENLHSCELYQIKKIFYRTVSKAWEVCSSVVDLCAPPQGKHNTTTKLIF